MMRRRSVIRGAGIVSAVALSGRLASTPTRSNRDEKIQLDGSEDGETNHSDSGPQEDDNYISEEEWEEREERQQELIDEYEESQNEGSVSKIGPLAVAAGAALLGGIAIGRVTRD